MPSRKSLSKPKSANLLVINERYKSEQKSKPRTSISRTKNPPKSTAQKNNNKNNLQS
jgi:hypothetical protein